MGVVRKRAWPFLALPGHRPPRARQLKMDLFRADAERPRLSGTPAHRQGTPAQGTAPCGGGAVVHGLPPSTARLGTPAQRCRGRRRGGDGPNPRAYGGGSR